MPIHSRGGDKHPPNQAQKNWRELLRSQGSVISGHAQSKIECHHPLGVTAQVKTIDGTVHLGHWFILMLTQQEHAWLGGDLQRFKRCLSGSKFVCQMLSAKDWDIRSMSGLELEIMLFQIQLARLISNGGRWGITVPGDALREILLYKK